MKTFVVFVAVFVLQFSDGTSSIQRCERGISAYLPDDLDPVPPQVLCKDLNEVFSCGFSEGNCDPNIFVCGTPPCQWRCWCRPGFRRRADGKCVTNCPQISFEASTGIAEKARTASSGPTPVNSVDPPKAAEAGKATVVETSTSTTTTRSRKT